MRPYADYTDEQITEEIAEYRAALKANSFGGVEEAAGEGRKIKYFGVDTKAINAQLRELYVEAGLRGMDNGGWNSAIGVEIG